MQIAGDRRITRQGAHDFEVLGQATYTVEASIGHIRDLAPGAKQNFRNSTNPRNGPTLGVNVDYTTSAGLYRSAGQEKAGHQAQEAAQGLRKTSIWRRTKTARGGHQLALARVAQTESPRPRLVFHEITKEAIKRSACREPARDRRGDGPRPGNPPNSRSAVRLRCLASCCGARSDPNCPPAACRASRCD
jgi:DNA topoisomerase IA